MKLNFWQIATTVIGITVAFLVVEEIKKHRYKKARKQGLPSFGIGADVGVDVGGETLEGNIGLGSRTVSY